MKSIYSIFENINKKAMNHKEIGSNNMTKVIIATIVLLTYGDY